MDEKSTSNYENNASLSDSLYSFLEQQNKPVSELDKEKVLSGCKRDDHKLQDTYNETEVSLERYLVSGDQNTQQISADDPKDSVNLSDTFYSTLQKEKIDDNERYCEKKSSCCDEIRELETSSDFEFPSDDRFSSGRRYFGDRKTRYTTTSLNSSTDFAVNLDNIKYFKQNIEPANYSAGAVKKITNVVKERNNEQKNIEISSVRGKTMESSSNSGKESNSLEPSDSDKNLYFIEEASYKSDVNMNVNDKPSQLVPLEYDKLEELVKSDTSKLVVVLTNQSVFKNLLKQSLSPDWIMLLVKALSKVSETDCKEKSNILSHASEMYFLQQISEYLKKLPFENNPTRQPNIDSFFGNLLVFFEALLTFLPHKACDVLDNMLDTTEMSIKCVEASSSVTISPENKEKLLGLRSRLEVRMSEHQKLYNMENTTINNLENENPPNDFHFSSVYPNENDILSNEKPFLRPNIVQGAYDSVEHYLDVQFRLLREDFLSPLRQAMTEYVYNVGTGKRRKKLNNARVYHPVYFVNAVIMKNKVALLVRFDDKTSDKKSINWETSKQFMFGSLLCFSRDHFATAFFGTVIDRSINGLKKGYITVVLIDMAHTTDDLFSSPFTLVESEVYFEPYYHVLNALQCMADYNFPMKRYIVDVECTSAPPKYVTDLPHVEYHIDDQKVKILDDSSWPSAESLNLDESQYNAFKSALTKEFVVIQGPPGTGKTFLGLKIVKALLCNSHAWNVSKEPILVICNTNHALDQFLEGVLASTDKIIRVGGQSKSEILSRFNLREKLNNILKVLRILKGLRNPKRIIGKRRKGEVRRTLQNLEYSEYLYYLENLHFPYDSRFIDDFNSAEYLHYLEDFCEDLNFYEDSYDREYLIAIKNLEVLRHQEDLEYLKNPESLKCLKQLERLQWDLREMLKDIDNGMRDIKRIQSCLESIKNHNGIVSLQILTAPEEYKNCFKDDEGDVSDHLFVEWLKLGLETFKRNSGINMKMKEIQSIGECAINDDNDVVNDDIFVTEALWDFELDLPSYYLKFALNLYDLKRNIEKIKNQLKHLQEKHEDNLKPTAKEIELTCQLKELCVTLQYWEANLSHEHKLDHAVIDKILRQQNLWQLEAADRWILYKYWLKQFVHTQSKNLWMKQENINPRSVNRYENIKLERDYLMMEDSLVIGMTTTGAARLQGLLERLKPRIVIVEEAAEVMESHIVVSLTRHCQHVILIGDHQQLRPNTATYRLVKDYHFDVSLFERMVNNGMHCEMLKVQHRMRPEVSKLIVPAIYPELVNHQSVYSYNPIKGVVKSVFFITHTHPEEENHDSDSHVNIHEAKFLMELARYLVLQGYSPEQITILSTYSGQMFYLHKLREKYDILKNTRITVVDNFQGEENDIILLSLVRSNPEAKIGFLKIQNRVCVALSRAKMGLFIIGNMDNLTKNSSIWPKIKESLEEQESINTHLTLRCQIHTTKFTEVSMADDFHRVPEGGCNLECNSVIPCGHKCQSICHVTDRKHEDYKCLEKCDRFPEKCLFQHDCKKLCWEDCGPCATIVSRDLRCGHTQDMKCEDDPATFKCQVMLDDVELDCKHRVIKPCFRDIATFPCLYDCEYRLPCGHKCELNCHINSDPDHMEYKCNKPCAKKNIGCTEDHQCQKSCSEECELCVVEVKKMLPCTHTHEVACSTDPKSVICKGKCKRSLPCGHFCRLTCNKPCGGCQVLVTKVFPECGHEEKVKCSEVSKKGMCKHRCSKTLSCGHRCTNLCSSPCTSQCIENVAISAAAGCKRLVYIPCYKKDLGDHKQLLPNTSIDKLVKNDHSDISLFEDMENNDTHCEVLMRPEAEELIVPTICPELQNYQLVNPHNHINGIVKSVFFITHTHPEEEDHDSESYVNIHEAKFLMELARYLVLQGYSPEQITILCTYSGQMFYLHKLRERCYMTLDETRITFVDNFQGEESDIILLSLVISNPEAKIGFLKTANGVCEALLRAKMGFYIIGNMDNLTKSSSIWSKMKESLEKEECINTHLTLCCQVHTAQLTNVSMAFDFLQVPEGGCKLKCNFDLPCRHKCRSVCHVLDRKHEVYKCLEICDRFPEKCSVKHKCNKLCWEDCDPCTSIVSRDLPCGHTQSMECGMDPATFKCQVMIDDLELDCKHRVRKPCFRDIPTFPCPYDCEYRLPCGHECELNCHISSDPDHLEYKCNKPCAEKNIGCTEDHQCQKTCSEECELCIVEVKKMLPCTHIQEVACSTDPKNVICKRKCKRSLSCGQLCGLTCDQPCGESQVQAFRGRSWP